MRANQFIPEGRVKELAQDLKDKTMSDADFEKKYSKTRADARAAMHKPTSESVAGPEKCWPGHRKVGTQPGTGKNAGKRVNDCEKIGEENKGLYYNVNKRKAAGTSRPASSPKAPTAQAWKDAAKTAKNEGVEEGLGSKLAGLGLAGAMALGAGGANARVTPDGQGGFTGGFKPAATVTAPAADVKPAAPASHSFSKEYLQKAADPNRTGRYMISVEKAQELLSNMQEGSDNSQKIGNMDADAFDDAMARLKKLAGAGPMRTVYDPQKRVYKNMPTAQQPAKQPKK